MTTLDIHSAIPNVQILTPADGETYETSLHRWSETSVRRAQYVILPSTSEEVSRTVLFASENKLEVAIKGGGHSCSGAASSEDLVIDLAKMNSVVVNKATQTVTVGGGATWAAVDEEAEKHNLAVVGGTVNSTGVGGLTVGGGYGFLTGKYGLVIDNLVEAEVVLANGKVVVVNNTQHADLFWAIRGAGSNFGPVTSFTFKAHVQPSAVWSGLMIFPPHKLEALFKAAEEWIGRAGEDEGANIFIACTPPDGKPALALLPFYNGSAEEGKKKFAAFYKVGPVADMTQEMPYKAVNTIQDPMTTPGDRKLFKATKFNIFDIPRFQKIFDDYSNLTQEFPDAAGSAIIIELYPHGVIESVSPTATAFANRKRGCSLLFVPRWKDTTQDGYMRTWATNLAKYADSVEVESNNEHSANSKAFSDSHGYANYGLGDERPRQVFGDNYERLSRLKLVYDPENIFHKWFPIVGSA